MSQARRRLTQRGPARPAVLSIVSAMPLPNEGFFHLSHQAAAARVHKPITPVAYVKLRDISPLLQVRRDSRVPATDVMVAKAAVERGAAGLQAARPVLT